jgi:hypothetical protein
MKNGDTPMNPLYIPAAGGGSYSQGITKREFMATQIMAGFAADPAMDDVNIGWLGDSAVAWADALLLALQK